MKLGRDFRQFQILSVLERHSDEDRANHGGGPASQISILHTGIDSRVFVYQKLDISAWGVTVDCKEYDDSVLETFQDTN